MCSTIRPFPQTHCFSILQVRLFWKAPTKSSHQNFILGHLLTPRLRSGGSKNRGRIVEPFSSL